jgi:hypothetical protein
VDQKDTLKKRERLSRKARKASEEIRVTEED